MKTRNRNRQAAIIKDLIKTYQEQKFYNYEQHTSGWIQFNLSIGNKNTNKGDLFFRKRLQMGS